MSRSCRAPLGFVVAIELCTLARRRTLVIAHHFNLFPALLLDRPAPATVCGQRRHLGGELTDPAHALGGRVGVVAELLCHPAHAATDAELSHGLLDRLGHHFSGRGIRSLQPGGEQCLAPCVGHVLHGHITQCLHRWQSLLVAAQPPGHTEQLGVPARAGKATRSGRRYPAGRPESSRWGQPVSAGGGYWEFRKVTTAMTRRCSGGGYGGGGGGGGWARFFSRCFRRVCWVTPGARASPL